MNRSPICVCILVSLSLAGDVHAESTERREIDATTEEQLKVEAVIDQIRSQMVVIPAGRFRMGCSDADTYCFDNERPSRQVDVASFRIGRYEITAGQYAVYRRVNGMNGNKAAADASAADPLMPAVDLSWHDAQQFIVWINAESGLDFRLPSEAEWEYAARAGSQTAYSWGGKIGRGNANCDADCGDAFEGAARVGSFTPNAFGLFDMHGNAWEWVADSWHDNYVHAPADAGPWAGGDEGRRVLRGGSWLNPAWYLRSSNRDWAPPAMVHAGSGSGFRLAQDL